MTKADLAHQLRARQHARGEVPAALIDAMDDEAMIDAYITCSCCGEKHVTSRQLKRAIWRARDAEHFLHLCNQIAAEEADA